MDIYSIKLVSLMVWLNWGKCELNKVEREYLYSMLGIFISVSSFWGLLVGNILLEFLYWNFVFGFLKL